MQAAAGSQDGVQHTTIALGFMALGLVAFFGFLLIAPSVTRVALKGKAGQGRAGQGTVLLCFSTQLGSCLAGGDFAQC